MNTLWLALLIFLVSLFSYTVVYPKYAGSDLKRLAAIDGLISGIIIIGLALIFWGSGAKFSFGFFTTNWFVAFLILAVLIDGSLFSWYLKRHDIQMADFNNQLGIQADTALFYVMPQEQGSSVGRTLKQLRGDYSVDKQLALFGEAAYQRVQQRFIEAGLSFPPMTASLRYEVESEFMTLSALAADGSWHTVEQYPVSMALGIQGVVAQDFCDLPTGSYQAELMQKDQMIYNGMLNESADFADLPQEIQERYSGSGIFLVHKWNEFGVINTTQSAAEELFVLVARLEGGVQVNVVSA